MAAVRSHQVGQVDLQCSGTQMRLGLGWGGLQYEVECACACAAHVQLKHSRGAVLSLIAIACSQ